MNDTHATDVWMTTADAARHLGISERQVKRYLPGLDDSDKQQAGHVSGMTSSGEPIVNPFMVRVAAVDLARKKALAKVNRLPLSGQSPTHDGVNKTIGRHDHDASYIPADNGNDTSETLPSSVTALVTEQAHHLQRVEQDVQSIKAYIAGDLGAMLRERLAGVPTRDQIIESTNAAIGAALAPLFARIEQIHQQGRGAPTAEELAAAMAGHMQDMSTKAELKEIAARLDAVQAHQPTGPSTNFPEPQDLNNAIAEVTAPIQAVQERTAADVARIAAQMEQGRANDATEVASAVESALAPVVERLQALEEQRQAAEQERATQHAEMEALRQRAEAAEQAVVEYREGRAGQPAPIPIQRPWWMFWGD